MEKKIQNEHSDARTTLPSVTEMIGLIKKLYFDYQEDVLKGTPEEREKSWERYKTLNHLFSETDKELQLVEACKDDSGHWYVIPKEMSEEFFRLLGGSVKTEDEFIEKFSEYMTGGDLNNVQLYAEI